MVLLENCLKLLKKYHQFYMSSKQDRKEYFLIHFMKVYVTKTRQRQHHIKKNTDKCPSRITMQKILINQVKRKVQKS